MIQELYPSGDHQREKAILVGVVHPQESRWTVQDYLDELALLTDTAGADVLQRVIQERDKIDPAFYIGRGKVELLSHLVDELEADLVIFDDDLTPAQVKNIENACQVKILDRSGLILDIFAKRAKTREAKTQVELAQLEYLLPRLTRQWTHFSRQYGGIGTKGPGETQLEVDRRTIRKRIGVLKKELEKIRHQRLIRRRHRENVYKVALVGYTNVGKSTLLNALTRADVFVENRLFATLDPTIRAIESHNRRRVLLIDTVGFIRKLPHHLVASFKSTLEETTEADLLLHVVDVSHPNFLEQMQTVNQVLKELQISEKPTLLVFNKVDRLDNPGLIAKLKREYASCILVSASRGIFLEELKKEILRLVDQDIQELEVTVEPACPRLISAIYDLAEEVETHYTDNKVTLKLRSTGQNIKRVQSLLEENGVKFY